MFAIGGGGGNECFYTSSIWKDGGSGGGGGDYYTNGAWNGGNSLQPVNVPMSQYASDGFAIGYGAQGGTRTSGHQGPHEGAGGGGAGGYMIAQRGGGNDSRNDMPGVGGDGIRLTSFIPYGDPPGHFGGGGAGGLYSCGRRTALPRPNGGAGGGGDGANMCENTGSFGVPFWASSGIKNTGGGGGGGSRNNTGGPSTGITLGDCYYGTGGGNGGDGLVLIKNSNSIYESIPESVASNSLDGWKDIKTWRNISLPSGKVVVLTFKSYIQSGTYYYTWRLFNKTKGQPAIKVSGEHHQKATDKNFVFLGGVHTYTEQPVIGFAVDPGDELTLQMRGCDGTGNTYFNSSQILYVRDLVVFAGGSNQTLIQDQKCYGGQTYQNSYRTIHTFTESGTLVCNENVTARYMIIAGGGGGGSDMGGGGGAGGYLTGTVNLVANTVYSIVVGAGGIGSLAYHGAGIRSGSNGSNSSAFGVIAIGGGLGGNSFNSAGVANGLLGGSGGGASAYYNQAPARTGGAGTAGQGNRGGNQSGTSYYGGGGGGAGGAGADANNRPNGGIGVWNDILEEGNFTLTPLEENSYRYTINGREYFGLEGTTWKGSNFGGGYYWAGGGGGSGYSSNGGYGGNGGGGAANGNSTSRDSGTFINDINRGGDGFNPGYDSSGGPLNSNTGRNAGDGGRNTGGGGGGALHHGFNPGESRGGRGGSGIIVISYDQGWALTPGLEEFTQINSVGMPHSVVSSLQTQGSTRISFKGAAAPSYGKLTDEWGFGSHGGHAGSSVFPIYWAFDIGTPQIVNQFKAVIHRNSWGYFFLEGSNNAGSGASFANQGTWTPLTTGQVQNLGGNNSGYNEGDIVTFNYINTTPYRYYRLRILDTSRPTSPVGTTYGGAAGYSWQFNRVK